MSFIHCNNLLLWRHADAEPLPEIDSPEYESTSYKSLDCARPLSKKGHKQAEKIAAWINKNAPKNTLIICSNALRAVQTAEALKRDYIVFASLAPGAALEEVLDTLSELPKNNLPYENLLVVGHQPWLGLLAAQLLNLPLSLPKNAKEIGIKKGALWWFKRPILQKKEAFKLYAVITPSLL